MGQHAANWAEMYDSVSGDLPAEDMIAIVVRETGARWGALAVEDDDGATVIANATYPTFSSQYSSYYAERDPWRLKRPRAFDRMVDSRSFLSPSDVANSELYNDLLRPNGIEIGANLVGATRINGHEAVLGLGRDAREEQFSEQQLQIAESALPHLRRIIRLKKMVKGLTDESAFAVAGLDALSLGVMRLDATGRVLFQNDRAEAVLNRSDGLLVRGGRLVAIEANADQSVQKAIALASNRAGEISSLVLAPRQTEATPYTLMFAPISRGGQTQVLLVIGAPDFHAGMQRAQLAKVFRLSNSEVELAIALSEGQSLAEFAAYRGNSINTLRVQLRSMLRKTNTARQAELVALIARLPPVRMDL